MAHGAHPSPFWPLLESTPSNSIVAEKRTLIAFLAEQPIEQVITALSQHHILSAPVVSSTDHTIVGSVDILSIAQYLIQHHGEEKQRITQVIAPSSSSSHEPIAPFYANNPLSLLVDLFATSVHRVALFTDACELVTPISQTDVIAFLAKNLEKSDDIKRFVSQTIQTAFGSRNVQPVTVSQETSVRDAIKTFISSGVSSVGIIDASHHLIGSFAASDLRGLVDVKSLSQPIGQYVKAHGTVPILVKADETIGNIIKVLATKHQHRVWVVDASNHPVSVISQTDIMRLIGSGATVTARQANADIEPTRLWIAPPQTVKVDYAMLRGDESSGLAPSSSIQVSASTHTKIGGI